MPTLVLAAAGYTITGGVTVSIGAAAVTIGYGAIIDAVVMTAASVAYSSSQTAKLRDALNSVSMDQGRTVMNRDPLAPRRLIYGQVLVSGSPVFMHTTGLKNEYLHLVIPVAGHECTELGQIQFNDEVVPLDSDGNATGKYAGYVRVKKHLGAADQEADADLISEAPGIWTEDHRLRGVAYLYVRLKWNADLFPNGLPTVLCLLKGKKVYDWRDEDQDPDDSTTWQWSDLVALCTSDFLHDPLFGKGVSFARIKRADVSEAANVCAEPVVLEDETEEIRYSCNGSMTADQNPNDVLLDLAGAMAGHVVDTGGVWTIRAGAWRPPELELKDSDLAGPISVVPRMSRQDTFNRVKGVYISPTNQWAAADFPAVQNETYKEKDGDVWLDRDVQYNWTTSPATAQRLAKIELERGRQQITCTGLYMLKAMRCMPGDVVELTRPRLGWNAKYFEVMGWTFKEYGDGDAKSIGVELEVRETAPGVWDWNDGEETTVDLAPNTDLPSPYVVPTPTGLALLSDNTTAIEQQDGTFVPALQVTLDAPSNAFVESGGHLWVDYKEHSASDWQVLDHSLPGDTTVASIRNVKGGVSYDVRARYENKYKVTGAFASVLNYLVNTDLTPPGDPADLAATALPDAVRLTWTNPTDNDFAYTEIYQSTSASAPNSATAATFNAGNSTQATRTGLIAGTPYYFWARARDRTKNKSNWSGPVSATPDVASGYVLTQLNGKNHTFYQTTAPTVGMIEGDLWFDTDDQMKVYRYTSGAWVSTQDQRIPSLASGLAAEITDRQADVNTEELARITADSGLGAAVTSEASARESADGSLGAEYVLKVVAGNRVAGFRITNFGGAGDSSDFVIQASTFRIVNDSGDHNTVPFLVDGTGVYIDHAIIREVDAGAIRAGSIAVALDLTTGGSIKSSNYVADTSGFLFDNDGNIYANNGMFRGTLRASRIDYGPLIGGGGPGLSAVMEWEWNGGNTWHTDIDDGSGNFRIFHSDEPVMTQECGTGATGTQHLVVWGDVQYHGSLTHVSSRRFKKGIKPMSGFVDRIRKLRPKRFTWKVNAAHNLRRRRDVGFIAEDVKEIFPEAVSARRDGTLGLDYSKLTFFTAAALAEHVDQTDRRFAELRREIKQIVSLNP